MFYGKPSSEIYACAPKVYEESKTLKEMRAYIEKHKDCYSETVLEELIRNISIENAVVEWLQTIKSNETKRKYGRAIRAFCTEGIIFPDWSIIGLDRWFRYPNGKIELLDKKGKVTESFPIKSGAKGILKWLSETTKKQYITAYSQFCDFIRTETRGRVDPESNQKEYTQLEWAENVFFALRSWKDFIKEIKHPYNLIAELIFYSAKEAQYRIKVVDPVNNILSLDKKQINFEDNKIHIRADQSYHKVDLVLTCPAVFMDQIKEYIGKRKETVFLSSKGTKLFPRQVLRAFAEASIKLEIPIITPVNLGWIGFIAFHQEIKRKLKTN